MQNKKKMWADLKNLEKKTNSLRNDKILKNEVYKNQQIVELSNKLNELTNERSLLSNKESLTQQQYTDLKKAYAEKSSNIMKIRLKIKPVMMSGEKYIVYRDKYHPHQWKKVLLKMKLKKF